MCDKLEAHKTWMRKIKATFPGFQTQEQFK